MTRPPPPSLPPGNPDARYPTVLLWTPGPAGAQRTAVDLDVLRRTLEGARPEFPRSSVKDIVRRQFTSIERARRRKLSWRHIASLLTAAGCPIKDVQLRKYASAIRGERRRAGQSSTGRR